MEKDLEKQVVSFVRKAIKLGKIIETRKVEFKERYELLDINGVTKKAVRAELVKDVMALANSASDPELETAFLIMGVRDNGEIVENYKLPVKDVAELDQIINDCLERPISFHYREYYVDDKKIGVIIIPRSTRLPHIASKSLSENDSIFLRKGDCWTRTEGKKKIAMGCDFDDMYGSVARNNKAQINKVSKKLNEDIQKKTSSRTETINEILSSSNVILSDYIKFLLK